MIGDPLRTAVYLHILCAKKDGKTAQRTQGNT